MFEQQKLTQQTPALGLNMSEHGGVGLGGGRSRNEVSSLLWCSSTHYSISVNLSASALFFSCASNVMGVFPNTFVHGELFATIPGLNPSHDESLTQHAPQV